MTPSENMNIHAQIFFQLQQDGKVSAKDYAEELATILLEAQAIITEYKLINAKTKEERLALMQFTDQLDKAKHRNTVVKESKIGIKFLSCDGL